MVGLMKNINRIARCAEQYRNDRLEPFGLTGSQYSVILSVCREPGITQDRLSELVYINKSNVARQLSQLEENGYVTREQGEKDRRTIKVFPTEKSLETVPVIRPGSVMEQERFASSEASTEETSVSAATRGTSCSPTCSVVTTSPSSHKTLAG